MSEHKGHRGEKETRTEDGEEGGKKPAEREKVRRVCVCVCVHARLRPKMEVVVPASFMI